MDNLAKVFKALGDKNRLLLLELIINGENCGCTLIDKLNVTQPTMTYHINILEKAGIITSRKEGVWRKLSVNKNIVEDLIGYLAILKQETRESKC